MSQITNPGVSPPDGDILFYWPKRGCRKGPATGVEHACSISGGINNALQITTAHLSSAVLNGDRSQWFSFVKVRTGSGVPVSH
jgi:hypothetical protein